MVRLLIVDAATDQAIESRTAVGATSECRKSRRSEFQTLKLICLGSLLQCCSPKITQLFPTLDFILSEHSHVLISQSHRSQDRRCGARDIQHPRILCRTRNQPAFLFQAPSPRCWAPRSSCRETRADLTGKRRRMAAATRDRQPKKRARPGWIARALLFRTSLQPPRRTR